MMYGWDFNGTNSWWMVAGMVIVAIAIVLTIWLIVHRPGSTLANPTAGDILGQRFARGEITREQFVEAKELIG